MQLVARQNARMKGRQQRDGKASILLLGLVVSGCSLIGHQKVAGWPTMEIVEHHVAEADMRSRCVKYVGFGMSPQACAEFDFVRNRCDVWFSADFPPTRAMVEHERLHCRGYDHIGMRTMADMLARYRGEDLASAGPTGK